MAKIAIRYDNIVPYGGIFYGMNEFKRTGLDKLVDGRLNVRCANYGYQYSDIMLALFSIYLCGGDHIEDITTILNKNLSTAPGARIPSSDPIARGLKELRALNIAYTSKTGSVYVHDPAIKLNSLLLDMALLLGILKRGQSIDVDFDNEFIPAEKSDALYSYKKKRGYFPGIDMKSRLKRFVFAFIVVPAKWIRVARQWTLNIYSKDRWLHYWTIFNASYG